MTGCPVVLILLGAEHRRSVWKIGHNILLGKPRILIHIILKNGIEDDSAGYKNSVSKGFTRPFFKK